ncbi:MAG: cyclase family protein [Alphaproteobacteria bacterium]
MAPRWKNRPEGSNWGEFGPDDQLGRLNLLTPEKVRQGVAEVREGRAFCLSLPLDFPGGNVLSTARFPPELRPTFRNGRPRMNYPTALENPAFTDVMCDDAVLIHLQYSTQWDALSHMGALFDADGDGVAEAVYYNGYRAGEHILGPVEYRDGREIAHPGAMGANALGIETMARSCVQGRGVLVDLARQHGRARALIGYERLMRAMAATGAEIERGDMLLLHTGFGDVVLEGARRANAETLHGSCAVLDGSDSRLLSWISDSGIAILATDNYAVEHYHRSMADATVARHGPAYPLHEHCLFKLGLPLGELWYLGALAAWLTEHKRTRFLLTAPPLNLPGAVGSPATPVATV